ncbi:TPA: ead/Ea22-like family protein [Escherichia coli]|nr:ead/Ea22-like family protein [Escherichia coli]EIM3232444.1 ead/Ea22-like family protein [Escherichia coli]MBX0024546.1 ead/Ea22-like family protein [Escherichia coli]NYO72024.1 ead/Ea22-like family protein [Escherichia coli]HAM5091810.1 ead/Ea22-like family protein [Escherichia coli]HAU8129925.1 ead/Ea22-like family protein [Escherichia coli]
MSKIDYQALRAKAEKATCGEWSLEYGKSRFDGDDALIHREVAGYIPICRIEGAHPESGFDEDFQIEQQANAEFIAAANPATVTALLDELERNQQYIKRRDQENEDIALTVGKLLIENGQLVADTLRHLADNEIDSDYFAITSTNENGTEIDHEMSITDYALQAAGTVDELVAALEAAEKRIAELSASHSKLRDTMAGIHNTIRMDGGYTPLAAILNAAKRAYEESASAAGIRIKGE